MDAKRFQQIEELYHAALACESKERSALLANADPELKREVEQMLAQDGSLLDHPAWKTQRVRSTPSPSLLPACGWDPTK
jgi:hypothetical protein